MNNIDLCHAAARLIGIPYRPASSTPQYGLDCAGMAATAYSEAYNVPLPVLPLLRPLRDAKAVNKLLAAYGTLLPPAQASAGDLLLFALGRPPIYHLAVLCPDEIIIHVHRRLGVCREAFEAGWRRRCIAALRLHAQST